MKDSPREVTHFDGRERLYVEIRIERAQAAQEVQIPILLQRWMQAADHVHFGYSKRECFSDCPDNFVTRIFKGMGVAFLGGEGAELAREYTDVGIIDVTVVDIAGVVSIFSLPHDIGDHPKRIKIIRSIQIQSIGL